MLSARAAPESTALDQAAESLKFLGDRNRLRIVSALAVAETCVCDLIDELGLPQPLVSYHLRKLREAGLVRARRDARWVYYSLDPDAWSRLTDPLANLFSFAPLPPAAAFGANHRCDARPSDRALDASRGDALDWRSPPPDRPAPRPSTTDCSTAEHRRRLAPPPSKTSHPE